MREILDRSKNEPGYQINVDLELQRIWDNNEDFTASFDIDPFRRHALMNGLGRHRPHAGERGQDRRL